MTPIQASYATEQTPKHERSSEASYANELAKYILQVKVNTPKSNITEHAKEKKKNIDTLIGTSKVKT